MADFGDEQQPQQEMQQDPFGDGGVPQQDDGGFAPMNDGGGDFGAQDGGFTPQEDTGFGGGGGMEVQQDDFSGGMAAPQEDDLAPCSRTLVSTPRSSRSRTSSLPRKRAS